MRRTRLLVVLLVLFLVAVLVTSVVGIALMLNGGGVSVEKGSTLVVDLSGPLPEQPLPEQPFAALGPSYVSMLEVDQVLHEAAFDERIQRVLIRIGGLAVGHGKLHELREIINRFSRDSGKATTCWMEAGSNKEYLLATACDEIFMAPEGFLLVNGIDISVTFFKGTLDKLGVEAEFTRAGKYKSAIEPLTSTEMSPAYREMLNSLSDSLFFDFVEAIAEARDMSHEQVKALINDPPLTASGAQRAGLIDGLYYRDQLLDHLDGKEVQPMPALRTPLDLPLSTSPSPAVAAKESESTTPAPATHVPGRGEIDEALINLLRTAPNAQPDVDAPVDAAVDADVEKDAEDVEDDTDSSTRIHFDSYQDSMKGFSGLGGGDRIAVIFCEGQIMSGSSKNSGSGSPTMGSDTITRAIRSARLDDDVKAIVLRIDSPGGSGLASDVIWRELQLAKEENHKPVIASMGDVAASGGYYIAMGADMIIAEPTTITGSIGVFAGKYNLSGLFAKIGLTNTHLKRGEMADLFAADKGLGETGRAKLSEFVDEFYVTFLRKAAAGRDTKPELMHRVAQGRVWTGRQAQQIGLVDELGSLRTAITIAKEKAGLSGDVKLRILPKQASFIDELLGSGQREAALHAALDRSSPLTGAVLSSTPAKSLTRVLQAAPLLSDNQPVLMAPYQLEVH
jgi:protease-4